MKQVSVAGADYSSTSGRTRRSYLDHRPTAGSSGAWDQKIRQAYKRVAYIQLMKINL